jgi:hypothetical protein
MYLTRAVSLADPTAEVSASSAGVLGDHSGGGGGGGGGGAFFANRRRRRGFICRRRGFIILQPGTFFFSPVDFLARSAGVSIGNKETSFLLTEIWHSNDKPSLQPSSRKESPAAERRPR